MSDRIFDDSKFDAAYDQALDSPKHDFPSKINGENVASGIEDLLVSPVDDTIIFGRLQDPVPGTMKKAAEDAARAFEMWSKSSPEERSRILSAVADSIEKRLYRLAADVVLSTGMVRKDAFAEAETCLEVVRQASKDAMNVKGKPRGVWGIIALESSPLASVIGYSAAAIAAGNTVVMMPSGHCPRPVYAVFDLFEQAGLPDGVLNLVCDRTDRFATELSDDENVAGVVASGCGKAMDDMIFLAVDDTLGYINEVKGMNPIVVSQPGDIKKAADSIIDSAFQNNGKGLYATSKVIVSADDDRELTKAIVERLKDLNVNDPGEKECQMGPLMNKEEEKRLTGLLDSEAAYVVMGGKRVKKEYTENGLYYTPILLTSVDPDDDIQYVDSGLPILVIKQAAGADAILQELDQTDCGLSVGVISSDSKLISKIKEFADEENLQVFVNTSSRSLKAASKARAENFTV
ncbi:NAD-dependent aldehyde dehydrogenase [Thermoplasmatales archaeon BRNA1]|nr:NAD-dependent aldehyde dehydrogenase [Thermoplasmatales archaeon BRNA1]